MEEAVKNRVIMILLILSIIFFLLWIEASVSVNRQRTLATNKAALTMELEEKNAKLEKEKSDALGELEKAKTLLSDEKTAHEATKKALSQEQVAEQALKSELESVTRLKETLEKDLKEALGNIESMKSRQK